MNFTKNNKHYPTDKKRNEGQPTGWDIAVDGALDSREFSAEMCKVLAMGSKMKLCIHTEMVHRSDRPPSTYALYAKLSYLHRNALRNAEIAGERVVKRSTIVHRKFKDRPIRENTSGARTQDDTGQEKKEDVEDIEDMEMT
ncbi:unnamed protein product [Cylicocyclus nassatus]|uniref:Uncharacterized protein n=1 Tax=Cylicocyclus nassatus TaxID=53992 RepID=A0AA36HBH3_CYLNA|nr:unnamed protein product [Cylicocyclus nassatus]